MNWDKVADACGNEFHNALANANRTNDINGYGPQWWRKLATILMLVELIIRAGLTK